MSTRIAVAGAGFWAQFQIAGWQELPGVEIVAICNRTLPRATELAGRFGIPAAYDDFDRMIDETECDLVDIITAVETHADLVRRCAQKRLPVICQKPMATTLSEARNMVEVCEEAGVWFAIHENWRYQAPMRMTKSILASGELGPMHRCRVQYSNSFPVFDSQPFLKGLEQFILTDIGSHVLDAARFLCGDAKSVYCQTSRVRNDIRGEDVATCILSCERCPTVVCEMSYASPLHDEAFPQTYLLVECEMGSIELRKDCQMWIHHKVNGTRRLTATPTAYAWADPNYMLTHSSIVDCNRALLAGFLGRKEPETSGADNLKTVELVFGSYESAATGKVVAL